MKKLLTIALALVTVGAVAQIDRSKLPEPAPAKELKLGDYEEFKLKNGLQVIVVENDKLPTLSWTLTFNTGPITEGDKTGYVGMVGPVLRGGTTSKTKEVLDEEIDFMGANIFVGSSSISAFSLSKYKEDVLKLMTDFLFNPSFPEEELEKAKKQRKTAILQGKDSPDQISSLVGSVLKYGRDHVYGEFATAETVDNITMDDIKKHYNTYFKPNIGYLVIVGDIKKREAQKLVKKYLSNWEKGDVEREEFIAPTNPEETIVALIDRPSSVQSVINITYTIDNKPGSEDNEKITMLNQILGGAGLSTRLNTNLREDKGYTYGANSSMGRSRYSASVNVGASVRNEVTDSALVQFMYELNRLRDEPVTDAELQLVKNTMRGNFGRSLESRGTAAQFALNAKLNNLPDDYYANYLKRIDAITVEDIQETAKKYIRPENAYIVIVGKAEEIADKLRPFGTLKFYDTEGNEVEDPTKVEVADINPQTIFDRYIEAIGGTKAVENVKSLVDVSEGSLSFGGQEFSLKRVRYRTSPDLYADVQTIPGQGELSQIYNAGEASIKAGGNKQVIPGGPAAALMKYWGVMFGERFYEKLGFESTYKGTAKVQDAEAHRIELKLAEGLVINEYYDVKTGLKIRVELGQQGTIDLSDYRKVGGIMVPHNFTQSGGQLPVPVSYISSEVTINGEVDSSVFK